MVEIDGYRFTMHRKTELEGNLTKSTWRCSTDHGSGCRANVKMLDDKIVDVNNIHNHEPKALRSTVDNPGTK